MLLFCIVAGRCGIGIISISFALEKSFALGGSA